MIVPLSHVVTLSLVLFSIGVIGLFMRRDAITIFLCVEIILNAANVAFIGVARATGDGFGHVATLIVIAVAAAEAAVGLTMVIQLAEKTKTVDLDELNGLRG